MQILVIHDLHGLLSPRNTEHYWKLSDIDVRLGWELFGASENVLSKKIKSFLNVDYTSGANPSGASQPYFTGEF